MASSPPPARRKRSKKNLVRRLPTEVLNEIYKRCDQASKISLSSTCLMLRSVGIDEVFRTRRLTWGYDRKYRTLGAAIGGLLDYVHLSKQTSRLQHLEIKANFDYTNDNDLEDADGEDVDQIYLDLQRQLVAGVEHPVIQHYFAREDEDVVRSDFDALRLSQYFPDRDVDSPLLLGDAYLSEYEEYNNNTPIDEVLDLAADSHIHFSNLHIDLHRMEEDQSLLVAAIARPIIKDLLLEIPSLDKSFVNRTLIPFVQSRFTSSPSSSFRLQIGCFDGSSTADSDLLALVPGLERIGFVQHWPQPSPSTGPNGKKEGTELEVRFNPSAVVGVRFNKIGDGGKVDPSFLRSLSSVFPSLESLHFLPGDDISLFEDWDDCLDAFGTFPYLQHLHVPWDITPTLTFSNALACSPRKWIHLAEGRPALHQAAVEQFGEEFDTSFLRLGISLNLRMVRRLASVLPLGCKVVWGGFHWKGTVVEGGEEGGRSMRGEWLRPVPGPRHTDCFVCGNYKGEDLLTAARRCRPEDVEAELALGSRRDRTVGGEFGWDISQRPYFSD